MIVAVNVGVVVGVRDGVGESAGKVKVAVIEPDIVLEKVPAGVAVLPAPEELAFHNSTIPKQ